MNIRYYENRMIGLVPETEQDKAWILGFWKKAKENNAPNIVLQSCKFGKEMKEADFQGFKDSDLQWEDIKVLEVWS